MAFKGEINKFDIGAGYILQQSAPCALMKFLNFFNVINQSFDPNLDQKQKDDIFEKMGVKIDKHNVTIQDARKNNPGDFHKSGFTLVELDEEPTTKGVTEMQILAKLSKSKQIYGNQYLIGL